MATAAMAVQPVITMRAPSTVEAGRLLTVTGTARPARPGVPVQLWELRGRTWVAIAEAAQRQDGTFAVRMRAGLRGRHTYRVVTRDTGNSFSIRSKNAVVTTVKPSTSGVRSTRMAATTPLGAYVGQRGDGPSGPLYATGRYLIGGRGYPDSVRTVSRDFTYELGADAATFGAAVALFPVPRTYKGPRLVEIKVDDAVRVRTFLRDGQAVPIRLDVRGKRVVRITTADYGSLLEGPGSQLLLGTPVVTSQALTERGVVAGTPLSNLRATAVAGPVTLEQVDGQTGRELFGGSTRLAGPAQGTTTGSVSYDLRGAYTRLVGVPGVFGETHPTLTGRVRMYGDNRLLADLPAPLWSYRRAQVDVAGVRTLRIELSATSTDPLGWGYGWHVVWGDGRLS